MISIALFGNQNRFKDVSGKTAKKDYEAFFLSYWATYIEQNPLQAKDRNSFAEMGFRTKLYSYLLENSNVPNYDYFERLIWPFCPGIKKLRQQHLQERVEEKGIVVSVGRKNWIFVNHLISQVRMVHKSDLIIEIHFYGEHDLPEWMRQYISDSYDGIRFIDLSINPLLNHTQLQMEDQGYALKPLASLMTTLTEFILVDADTVFLMRPEMFFESKQYLETGTLFFHDRHYEGGETSELIHGFLSDQLSLRKPSKVLAESKFWKKKGIFQQESGLIVFDKKRTEVFTSLLFVVWQNLGEVRDQLTYRIFWGDKESFWLAFELSEKPYSFAESYAGGIGQLATNDDQHLFCSEHPLHFLNDNFSENGKKRRPAWFNGSLLHDKRRDHSSFIQPALWAMDGDWKFLPTEENWCLVNYTQQSLEQFGLKLLLNNIVQTAKIVDENAWKALDEYSLKH